MKLTHTGMDQIDADETTLAVVHRHLFGIIILYVQAIIGLSIAFVLIFLLLPTMLKEIVIQDGSLFAILGGIVVVLIVGILLIATVVYRLSRLIVTDKNIVQVLQQGLFGRKVSQLALTNVEDVTAEQHGIFAMMFNYGLLKVETAGEQVNFHYSMCPNPNYYAKLILEAREKCVANLPQSPDISRQVR